MKTPDDHHPSVNDERVIDDVSEPAPTEEPAVVSFSEPDFDAMLGGYHDLALHVVLRGDDDGHEPRARVGRYERRDA